MDINKHIRAVAAERLARNLGDDQAPLVRALRNRIITAIAGALAGTVPRGVKPWNEVYSINSKARHLAELLLDPSTDDRLEKVVNAQLDHDEQVLVRTLVDSTVQAIDKKEAE